MHTSLLVIDDDRLFTESVRLFLSSEPFEVELAHSLSDARAQLDDRAFDLVVVDDRLPDGRGLELSTDTRLGDAPLIVVTAYPEFDHAVEAVRRGVVDYLTKPLELSDLRLAIERCVGLQQMRRRLEAEARLRPGSLPGPESVLAEQIELVRNAEARRPQARSPILITGETGTGKTWLARILHEESVMREGPFVAVNCAAVPAPLLEAELFGTEAGAFTGARTQGGLLELADRGTLFLDEIGELPVELQAKLLTTLDQREFRRVGGRQVRRVDFRLIAATNRDLEEAVAEGRFREDVYYRLNVLRLRVPPLRERQGELGNIVDDLLRGLDAGPRVRLAEGELERLRALPWRGNVRELRNVLERSLLGTPADRPLRPSDFAAERPRHAPASDSPWEPRPLEDLERDHILRALEHFGGHRHRTAEALGISLATLRRRLRAYGVPAPR